MRPISRCFFERPISKKGYLTFGGKTFQASYFISDRMAYLYAMYSVTLAHVLMVRTGSGVESTYIKLAMEMLQIP